MTPTILAAASAIIGIVLGRFWDVRAESSKWRRDQKTASYQRYAEDFQVGFELVRTIALADHADDAFTELVRRARTDGFKASDSAFIAVWIHGSAAVVEAATTVEHTMSRLFEQAQERTVSEQEWKQMRGPARLAFEQFLAAMRHELDLPLVSTTFFRQGQQPTE